MTDGWVTIEMPADTDPSLTHQPGGDWQWGNDGSPEEREQSQQQAEQDAKEREAWLYHAGAVSGEAFSKGVQWSIAESSKRAADTATQASVSFFGPIFGALGIAGLAAITVGLHGVLTSPRPLLNGGWRLFDGAMSLLNPGKFISDSFNVGNQFGPYEVATPYLYDQSPPGSWDFTLIDPETRSQAVPVPSPCNGVVSQSGWISGYGNSVAVDCFSGTRWFMAHNESLSVDVEDRVQRGDELAIQGSTGNSTGPHIHAEITPLSGDKTDRAATKALLDSYFELLKSAPSDNIQLASFDQSQREQQAIAYFLSQGFTPTATAYLVGSLKWESGLDPQKVGDGGIAKGLNQWWPDRRSGIPETFEGQLQWVIKDMQADTGSSGTLQVMRSSHDPSTIKQAIEDWTRWEILGDRWIYAEEILAKMPRQSQGRSRTFDLLNRGGMRI